MAAAGILAPGAAEASVDVLVVGAGGAGLACAIAAHDAGASVAVLEKLGALQGNTMLSSGSIPAAGTRFQRAAGIEDDAGRFAADLRRQAGAHDNDALVDLLARTSAPLVEWLADTVGLGIDVITEYRHVGHSVPRLHAPTPRRGSELMAALARAAAERDIPVLFDNPVTALQWLAADPQCAEAPAGADAAGDASGGATRATPRARALGRVCGVEVQGGTAAAHRIEAKAVVLATNGFAANPELRARFCAETLGFEYAGAPGSEGEAVAWGQALGARLANMGAYQAHASYAIPHGMLATWTLVEMGGIVVDRHGRRFGDESLGYSGFAAATSRAEGPLHVVYDARIRERTARGQQEYAELAAHGGAIEAADAAALAVRIGVDARALAATLETAARAARQPGVAADPFGRSAWGMAPLEPPLVATRITTAILHTQGGLAVDAQARVLRGDDSIVEGLYAAGGAAAGISGRAGSGGYSSGNGLLSALGLGLIAGRCAAAHAAARSTMG